MELNQVKADHKKSFKRLKQYYEKDNRINKTEATGHVSFEELLESDLEKNQLELSLLKEPVKNNIDNEMLETMIDAHLKVFSKNCKENFLKDLIILNTYDMIPNNHYNRQIKKMNASGLTLDTN